MTDKEVLRLIFDYYHRELGYSVKDSRAIVGLLSRAHITGLVKYIAEQCAKGVILV